MISRNWHGWTTLERADTYKALPREEIFTGIEAKQISGFQNIQLLKPETGDVVEFLTIMRFNSLDAVRALAGEDNGTVIVPEKARAVLKCFNQRSQYYEV